MVRLNTDGTKDATFNI
ncbi:TPA: hypothetical protein DCZ39_01285 [Patescibacteria group bacterium]|nr:hypothetical protein [Candidatus Gracilibacteria bacterium]